MTGGKRAANAQALAGAMLYRCAPSLFLVSLACGGATSNSPGENPEAHHHRHTKSGAASLASDEARDTDCPPPAKLPSIPSHHSEKLYFDVPETTLPGAILLRADIKNPLRGASAFEIEVITPTGQTHTHPFSHQNQVKVCPNCLPSGDNPDVCKNVRCYWDSVGAARVELPVEFVDESGPYTLTLHHLATGEKLTKTMRVTGVGDECALLPKSLAEHRRDTCTSAMVPIGARYWGTRARYDRGGCRSNVFSLRLSQAQRVVFLSGWGKAKTQTYANGVVHVLRTDEGRFSAWLGKEHAYFVATVKGVGGHDDLVGELLRRFPPDRSEPFKVPQCKDHQQVQITVETREELLKRARLFAEFEGSQVIGVQLGTITQGRWFERASFRPRDIVYSFNGTKIDSLAKVEAFIASLSKPGTLKVVLKRRDYPPRYPGGIRCHTLTLQPAATSNP